MIRRVFRANCLPVPQTLRGSEGLLPTCIILKRGRHFDMTIITKHLILLFAVVLSGYPVLSIAGPAIYIPPNTNQIVRSQRLLAKGFSGQGVRIGIISGGATNYAALVKARFLPSNISFAAGDGSGDEGDWMLQVAHDVAPSARLAFCPSASQGETVECAAQLIREDHAQIIVYDVNPQPVYWGPTKQAQGLDKLARRYPNVLFFTGAGNNGGGYYQSRWIPIPLALDGQQYYAQNFGSSVGKGSDAYDRFLVPPHTQAVIILGDNQPAAADRSKIILALMNTRGHLLMRSPGLRSIQQLRFTNESGQPRRIRVAILVSHKVQPKRKLAFKLVVIQAGQGVRSLTLHFSTPGAAGNSALSAHSLAIGAVDPGSDFRGQYLAENFTNSGPQCIDMQWRGGKLTGLNNNLCIKQPALVAPDRTMVAMPADTARGYVLRPFVGDSAAAPVAGAAAAVLLSAKIPASRIVALLTETATPMTRLRAWSSLYGHGLIDVDAAAVQANVLVPGKMHDLSDALQKVSTFKADAAFKYAQHIAVAAQRGEIGALNRLQANARAGNVDGMAWLGWYYLQMHNQESGANWLWVAAQAGNPFAQSLLGSCFNRGWGTVIDPRAAYAWWLRAAEAGEPDALYNLGTAYASGRGITNNLIFAYALMQASSLRGAHLPWAKDALAQLGNSLYPGQQKKASQLAQLIVRNPIAVSQLQISQ